MPIRTWMEEVETNSKNTVGGYLEFLIMWAFCSVHFHGNKLGYIYTVFQKELKWLIIFILLSQPAKCRMGVIPLRAERRFPQPAIYPCGPGQPVRNANSQAPLLTCCIRTCILTRLSSPTTLSTPWPRCSMGSVGLEDRSPHSKSLLWNWNIKSRRLVRWPAAFTLGIGVWTRRREHGQPLRILQLGVFKLQGPIRNTACMGVPTSSIVGTNSA